MKMADPSAKSPSKRAMILRVTGTVIAFVLLIFLLAEQGWSEIWKAISQIPLTYLAVALCLMIVSRLAVVARWYVLLRSARLPISYWQTARITFAGLFASNFLPTTIGGDVVRFAGAVRFGLDGAISLASLVVDRIVGLIGMASALPLGIPSFQAANFFSNIPANRLVAFQSILPLFLKKLVDKGISIVRRTLVSVSIWLKDPLSLLMAFIYTWINMLGLFGVLYLLFAGQGESISFGLIAGLYSVVYLITLIPISINGYGVQELSMTLVFSKLAGVSIASALTTALLFRTFMMLVSTPGAIFIAGLISGNQVSDTETGDGAVIQ